MKLQEITGEFINLQEITGDILKIQEFTGVYRITGGLGGLLIVLFVYINRIQLMLMVSSIYFKNMEFIYIEEKKRIF